MNVVDGEFGVGRALGDGGQVADAAEGDELDVVDAAVVGDGDGESFVPAPELEVGELGLDDFVHGVGGDVGEGVGGCGGEEGFVGVETAVVGDVSGEAYLR